MCFGSLDRIGPITRFIYLSHGLLKPGKSVHYRRVSIRGKIRGCAQILHTRARTLTLAGVLWGAILWLNIKWLSGIWSEGICRLCSLYSLWLWPMIIKLSFSRFFPLFPAFPRFFPLFFPLVKKCFLYIFAIQARIYSSLSETKYFWY